MSNQRFSLARMSRSAFLRIRNFLSSMSLVMTASLIFWLEVNV